MVKIEDLKRINIFKNVSEKLLEIIAKEAQLSIFGTDTQLITIHEKVDTFYMLLMGQVAVKKELTPEIDVIIDYIQAGSCFGVYSIIEGSNAFYTAVCQEPCELITISGPRMIQLFAENHELAYYLMQEASERYKRYMDERAQMILKTLGKNRDIEGDDISDS